MANNKKSILDDFRKDWVNDSPFGERSLFSEANREKRKQEEVERGKERDLRTISFPVSQTAKNEAFKTVMPFLISEYWLNILSIIFKTPRGSQFLSQFYDKGVYSSKKGIHSGITLQIGYGSPAYLGEEAHTRAQLVNKQTKEITSLPRDYTKMFSKSETFQLLAGSHKEWQLYFFIRIANYDPLKENPTNDKIIDDLGFSIQSLVLYHEFQHIQIALFCLSQYINNYTVGQHHGIMYDEKEWEYFNERYDFYKSLKYLWHEAYIQKKVSFTYNNEHDFIYHFVSEI